MTVPGHSSSNYPHLRMMIMTIMTADDDDNMDNDKEVKDDDQKTMTATIFTPAANALPNSRENIGQAWEVENIIKPIIKTSRECETHF